MTIRRCFFFVLSFVYYYFYFLFTSLLTPRVIQNHITRVFIYKSSFKPWKKKKELIGSFVSVFNISGCLIYYRVFVLIWHGLSPRLFYESIGSLDFTAAVSSLNLILTPNTAYYPHMETQNHTCCKRNYTLLYFYISEELIT